MSLKWQLDHIEAVTKKNGRSILADVTERTQEVIPVQDALILAHFYTLAVAVFIELRCPPSLRSSLSADQPGRCAEAVPRERGQQRR